MQRTFRFLLIALELLILTALVLTMRCANYQDVFVRGNVYFTDADCYARMTRVKMCVDHPGLIIRHHDFENFPLGTAPHTTAPLDYLIVGLSILLRPFTSQPIDLAGAIVSPFLALVGGWFLWWWSRRMELRFRWVALILYAISPILVHGTEVGRPDHQSLLIILIAIGVCAEWTLQDHRSRNWSLVSGIAWGLASWVSFYEPLLLLAVLLLFGLTKDRHLLLASHRRIGWIVLGALIATAFMIERRFPSLSIFRADLVFKNWSHAIGELTHISLFNRIWFVWAGYLILIAPVLIWISVRRRTGPPIFVLILLVTTFLLTVWQARWGYFFLLIFAISLPTLLTSINSRAAAWIAFAMSIFPIAQFWDARIWPNESELAARMQRRNESCELRELALSIHSKEKNPFLAPWWLSPSLAYWSGQPAVAGSSHEAIDGIADSARFLLTDDPEIGREILKKRGATWIFAYDSDRVIANGAGLLGLTVSERPLGRILDRTPTQAPAYLVLSGQNGAAKLFRFIDKL